MAENPLNDFELLSSLVVGIGEVAEISGVPARQIRYWEQKGIITSVAHQEAKNRRYDYLNIKKILLIKELIDEGFTLEAAAKKVALRIEVINAAFSKLKSAK